MNTNPQGQQPQGYYGDKQSQHPHAHGQQPAVAYEHAQKLPGKFQFSLFDCFSPMGTCESLARSRASESNLVQAV